MYVCKRKPLHSSLVLCLECEPHLCYRALAAESRGGLTLLSENRCETRVHTYQAFGVRFYLTYEQEPSEESLGFFLDASKHKKEDGQVQSSEVSFVHFQLDNLVTGFELMKCSKVNTSYTASWECQ